MGTSSLITLSIYFILSNLLHTNILKASILPIYATERFTNPSPFPGCCKVAVNIKLFFGHGNSCFGFDCAPHSRPLVLLERMNLCNLLYFRFTVHFLTLIDSPLFFIYLCHIILILCPFYNFCSVLFYRERPWHSG